MFAVRATILTLFFGLLSSPSSFSAKSIASPAKDRVLTTFWIHSSAITPVAVCASRLVDDYSLHRVESPAEDRPGRDEPSVLRRDRLGSGARPEQPRFAVVNRAKCASPSRPVAASLLKPPSWFLSSGRSSARRGLGASRCPSPAPGCVFPSRLCSSLENTHYRGPVRAVAHRLKAAPGLA